MLALSTPELEAVATVQRRLLSPPAARRGIDGWRRRVSRALMEATGADFALFQLPMEGVPLLYSAGLDPEKMRAYERRLDQLDERVDYSGRMARMGVGIRSTLWSDRMRWLYRSAYYNEIVRPARAFDPLWAAVPVPGSRRLAAIHAYHADPAGPRFGERGLAVMRLLRPALEAAVHILRRFRERREGLLRTLDALPEAVFLVDRRGLTLHRNPAATALAHGEPPEGRLAAAVARAARSALQPFHEGAPGGQGVAARARTRRGVVDIRACRLEEEALGCPAAALVTVRLTGWTPPPGRELQERLGLTPRQAEVARLLARRATNREIAEALDISPNTAARHTEAVLSKLGVSSRRRVRDRIRPPLPGPGGSGVG